MSPKIENTSAGLRRRLDLLYAELAASRETSLQRDPGYMDDLQEELDEVYAALAMATVLEQAMARARVQGPLQG